MDWTAGVDEHTPSVGRVRNILEVDLPAGPYPSGRSLDLPERGGRMFISEMGSADKPTLVLLHGWTATGRLNWQGVMPVLAEHFHVIAVDQRGHGRGIRSREPFSLEACAEDIVGPGGLLDHLGIPAAYVAGYSMGGPVAQLAARQHPERVDGIVNCATGARFPKTTSAAWAFHVAGAALGMVPPVLLKPVPLPARVLQLPGLAAIDDLRHGDPVSLLQAGEALAAYDSREWASDLRCPAASIITTADVLEPVNIQRELAALTNASIYTVGSLSGHLAAGLGVGEFGDQLLAACLEVRDRSLARQAGRPQHPLRSHGALAV